MHAILLAGGMPWGILMPMMIIGLVAGMVVAQRSERRRANGE